MIRIYAGNTKPAENKAEKRTEEIKKGAPHPAKKKEPEEQKKE